MKDGTLASFEGDKFHQFEIVRTMGDRLNLSTYEFVSN
jgi:hypothetical protein